MATAVSKVRVLELIKTRCALFNQTFNPQNLRTGNKVLRQRLRGSALASYYPAKIVAFQDLEKLFSNLETFDELEGRRVESTHTARARGKGPPKKKRTAQESKKLQKRRPLAAASNPTKS